MSAPAVAVSRDGKKFAAAWKDVRASEPNVFWSVSGTGSFASEDLLHEDLAGEQDHPALAIDGSGTVWAAWEDSRSGKSRIWTRSSTAGDFGRELSDAADGEASFTAIAAGGGVVAVVYEAKKGKQDTVVFRRLD